MDSNKIHEVVLCLEAASDEDIQQILKDLPRLDFDRVRRTANWLLSRRNGR